MNQPNQNPATQNVTESRKQINKGAIRRRIERCSPSCFGRKHGVRAISGLYQGYLDMTYFALFPTSLKRRGLKVAIVFNYDAFRFEAWLAARNRKVQRQYCEEFKDCQWAGYRVVTPAEGIDSIIECDLAREFDFSDSDALTSRIERPTTAFIENIETFLSSAHAVQTRCPSPAPRRVRMGARRVAGK